LEPDKFIDAKLIMAYKEGDQEALTALVKRWHLEFCTKAYWIVKNQDVSKDIAQDTWQTIITKLDSLEDPYKFRGWALRIVCNKAFDMLRSQQRKWVEVAKISVEQDDAHETPNEQSHLKTVLAKAILNLPYEQKSVVQLFYLEAYSLKEIGNILQISEGTVKSRLFYAREKLKLIVKNSKKEY